MNSISSGRKNISAVRGGHATVSNGDRVLERVRATRTARGGPYRIAITNLFPRARLPLQKLRAAVRAVLIREQVEAAKVEITLVDDETIAQLNSAYLGHEGPTDVLTFDLTERRPERRRRRTTVHRFLEGHIITSVETAVREAKRRGLPWPAELCLYLVHGVLHLVGYQDDTAESAKRMHVQEDEILRALGWGPVFAAEPR